MVEGDVDPETGYVLDVALLKAIVEREVTSQLDHKNLNLDVPWFAARLPSAENIAVFIWERLASRIPGGAPVANPPLGNTATGSNMPENEERN
jgi:6-pyruvoyltetrahydropterin/6-carboxytetrahydropterin synthase